MPNYYNVSYVNAKYGVLYFETSEGAFGKSSYYAVSKYDLTP